MSVMHDYQARPGVDTGRLRAVLSNLERLRTELNSAGALFMQRLRDSEFLNAIKHRSTIPGGTCEFDLPDYRHWLDQPFAVRSARLRRVDGDDPAAVRRRHRAAVADARGRRGRDRRPPSAATSSSRSSATIPVSCCASRCRRARTCFPEISGSHHRCSIRFLRWTDANARPGAGDRGREVPADRLHVSATTSSLPDLRAGRRVERKLAVAAVLQRALQADRSRRLGVGAARDPGQRRSRRKTKPKTDDEESG